MAIAVSGEADNSIDQDNNSKIPPMDIGSSSSSSSSSSSGSSSSSSSSSSASALGPTAQTTTATTAACLATTTTTLSSSISTTETTSSNVVASSADCQKVPASSSAASTEATITSKSLLLKKGQLPPPPPPPPHAPASQVSDIAMPPSGASNNKTEPQENPLVHCVTTVSDANNNQAATKQDSASTQKAKPAKRARKTKASTAAAATKPTESEATATTNLPSTSAPSSPNKRKSRSASNKSNSPVVKRVRKKKSDTEVATSAPPTTKTQTGAGPLMIDTPPVMHNRLMQGISPLDGGQVFGNRYFPYSNFEHLNPAPSLYRPSLSRLFTSSSATTEPNLPNPLDDPAKAFEELREQTWGHLHKFVLDQAQQFDIASLIATLYTLRSENEKLGNKVRDLTMRRDQLLAVNARLDLPGPMLTQHLNNTSPGFSSVVSGLTNSPSPGSSIGKQSLISVNSFNPPPGSLVSPNYTDPRGSPLTMGGPLIMGGHPHSGVNNKSPPIGALMAHSNNNRAGLITVNPPYMSNVFHARLR